MLYEAYEKKIIRIANVRDAIVRRKFLIIGIFAFLMVLLGGFLFARGIILDDVSCPDSVTYGDDLACASAALFGDTEYEYSADGVVWSAERPTMPGGYYVRAVSRRTFGIKNYGEPRAFVILPRAVQVTSAASAIYGELPAAVAYGLADGDTLAAADVTLDDKRAAATTAEIAENSVRIENAAGADVTAAYSLTLAPQAVTVRPRALTIATGDAAKDYDGTPLTSGEWSVTEGSLVYDDTPNVTVTGQITDAGAIKNGAVVHVAAGETDVTAMYAVTLDAGTLTVAKRQLTLKSDSAVKTYDGTPLNCARFRVTAGAYATGEKAAAVGLSERTDAGESTNALEYAITAADGRDTTRNYDITAESGTLTVKKRQLTLLSGNDAKVYDGKALSCASYAVTSGSFADGETASVASRAELVDVGKKPNELGYEIKTAEGRIVTDNYELTADSGTLEVTHRPLTLQSADANREYNGAPLFSESFAVAQGAFADGQSGTVVNRTEITDVGEIANAQEYKITDADGNDVTTNYALTLLLGTLTVSRRALTLTADTAEKVYDGTPLTCATFTADRLVAGHTAAAATVGSQTDVGSSPNKIEGAATVRDASGRDVTANYVIRTRDGALTVYARQIKVTAGSASKVYDGKPLTCADYTCDNLIKGHSLAALTEGAQTDVGASDNAIVPESVKVTDARGADVSHNYTVTAYTGTLTVTPRPITIISADASKEYDGTELYCRDFELKVGTLVGRHTIGLVDHARGTDAGVAPNKHIYMITDPDADDRDVTFDYLINAVPGTLEITPRPITVQTGSSYKIYDGERLFDYAFWITEGSLVGRHEAQLDRRNVPSIYNVGIIENKLVVTVYDPQQSREVTTNYDITFVYGTLEIKPRPLTVTANSATKQYDGKPLRCGTVSADDLVTGQSVDAKTRGSQTEIGIGVNEVIPGSVRIVDNFTNEITTRNYDITYEKGTLTVVEQLMGGDSGEGSGEGGGSGEASGIDRTGDLSSQFGAGGGKDTTFLYVLAQEDGSLYLRDLSYGDYTYYGWTQATPYGEKNPLYYVHDTLAAGGASDRTLTIQSVIEGLPQFTPYYAANMGVGDDVHIGAEALAKDACYSARYLPYDYTSGLEYRYSEAETAYAAFVRRNYLTVPLSTREVMLRLADENSLRGIYDRLTLIAAVRDYIAAAATYDMDFVIPDDAEDMIVYFLTEGKRGVCQHFASAAVLMFRSLGLPARYVTGFAAYGAADKWVAVTGRTAHAWVEVYVDGVGWLQVEVTPAGEGGSGGGGGEGGDSIYDEQGRIIVRPADTEAIYDGSEQRPTQKLYRESEVLFGKGTHCTFDLVGSRIEPGVELVYLENLRIFDAHNTDITAQFEVVYKPGTFAIMPVPITISPYYMCKEYDGTPLVCDPSYYYVSDGELLAGHRSEAVASGSLTEAGESVSTVSHARIYDAAGNDVTAYYAIDYGTAPLVVERRAITITSMDEAKIYDGTPLIATPIYDGGFRISSGSLADGDYIYIDKTAYLTEWGTIDNTFVAYVYKHSYYDVTANYDITYDFGTLTVHKRPLSIKTHGATKPYDGTPLAADGYDLTGGSLAAGHKLIVNTLSEQTTVGECPNLAEACVVDADGNDVTANYDLKIYNGILKVT